MKLKVLVASLALLASTAMASASDSAWFSLEGSSAGVTAMGGPGQTLVIEKPAGPSTTVLTIGFNISSVHQYGVSNGALASWGFELAGGNAGVSYSNGNFGTLDGATFDTPTNVDLMPGGIGTSAVSSNASGSAGLVFTFDLTIVKPPAGDMKTAIFGDWRTTANPTGFAWYGSFGPTPNTYGLNDYSGGNNPAIGNLPVISINNVPEPATIALLGMGVVALIRRRR